MNVRSGLAFTSRLLTDHAALSKLRALQNHEFIDRDKLENVQAESLERLIHHCRRNVPFYASRFPDGFEWNEVPLLTKSTIRSNFDQLTSSDSNRRGTFPNHSGGSTGEPVRVLQDQEYRRWSHAINYLRDLWTGQKIGDKKIVLWGSERDLIGRRDPFLTRAIRMVRNELWFNAYRVDSAKLRSFVDVMNTKRPHILHGYAESLHELARYCQRSGLSVRSPRAIQSSSGTLTAEMRKTIEGVLGAPVFNRYGSREVSAIASECSNHSGLHVTAPTHIVEVLKPDGTPAAPGEIGRLIVTSLTNYSFPLIRYEIGDEAAWALDDCPCGRKWPLLDRIQGRTSDYLRRLDGERVRIPVRFFSDQPWIHRYQVVQIEYDVVDVYIQPWGITDNIIDANKTELIRQRLISVMGDCDIRFHIVDEISPSASGKHRYTVCLLKEGDN